MGGLWKVVANDSRKVAVSKGKVDIGFPAFEVPAFG